MKVFTYIIAMLALLSGAAWSWEALVTQVPPAKIASVLPVMKTDEAAKAEPQPADAMPQYARLARADQNAGPSPIYPASPGKELLGTLPPLPRAVVARQKAMAKLAASGALTAMAKASPREAKRAVREASAKPQVVASNRAARSYQSGQPLQLHPQQRWSDTLENSGSYQRREPTQVMGYAAEPRRNGFLAALFD